MFWNKEPEDVVEDSAEKEPKPIGYLCFVDIRLYDTDGPITKYALFLQPDSVTDMNIAWLDKADVVVNMLDNCMMSIKTGDIIEFQSTPIYSDAQIIEFLKIPKKQSRTIFGGSLWI